MMASSTSAAAVSSQSADEDQRDAPQEHADREVRGEALARHEHKRQRRADEAADTERRVEVADAALADSEQSIAATTMSTLSAPATSVCAP